MTGTEIATRPVGALALDPHQTEWTERQRAALEQLGLAKAPAGDLAVFLHQAQRTGLDPFTKQIYMIGRWDGKEQREKYTIQTGIDGFRVIAERPKGDQPSPYGGQVGPEWCGEDGKWRDVWLSNKPPVAARVGIIRKDWPNPIYATAHFREYAGTTKDGSLTKMWREKGALMIAKCAEALALRKAFPQDLSGIYTAEEMGDQPPSTQVTAERADQPTQAADQTREGLDWDELLADAEGDPDALRDLWALAGQHEPNNSALFERIKEAGIKAAAKEAEPVDAEIVDEHPAPPADEPGPVNQAQLTHLAALCTEHGAKERGHRLALLSKAGDKRLTSMKDLTFAEATKLIDTFHYLVRTQRIATVVTEAAKHAHEFTAEATPAEQTTAPDNSQES